MNEYVVETTSDKQQAEEWLLTEGNQYMVIGGFRRNEEGKVVFQNERQEDIPLPIWAVVNMLVAFRTGKLKTGLFQF